MKNNITFEPIIKWSGSKRSQALHIIKEFPQFQRYYEPFIGGGSIMYAINSENAICGDICSSLIELWKLIQLEPKRMLDYYKLEWQRLQDEGYQVYYEIRDRFNKTKNPLDLFFLSRTCVNGLIRFNKDGDFNNSLHHTRKGVNPSRLEKIVAEWSIVLKNVEFRTGDYRDTTADINSNDFIYLDPPYFNTKGRYYGTINYDEFLKYLETLNSKSIKYALSFDGIREDRNYIIELPKDLYKRHILLESGNSSFKKVMDNKTEVVKESLYLNYL